MGLDSRHPLLHPLPHGKGPRETVQAKPLSGLDRPKLWSQPSQFGSTTDRPLDLCSLEVYVVTHLRSDTLEHVNHKEQ